MNIMYLSIRSRIAAEVVQVLDELRYQTLPTLGTITIKIQCPRSKKGIMMKALLSLNFRRASVM